MALRFFDGFDHYHFSDILKKWTTQASMTLSATTKRTGTNSLHFRSGSPSITKTIDAQASWIIGGAFYFTTLGGTPHIIQLLDSASIQVAVLLNADGTFTIQRAGTNSLTNGTSTNAVSLNTWYYIEFKVTIADSIAASSCKLRVDGTDWITVATGQDTKNTSNASANIVKIANASGVVFYLDDFYACDGTGSTNNDFLGKVSITTLYPSANGDTNEWTPYPSGSNYDVVNSEKINESEFVKATAAGATDLYAFTDLSSSDTIYGVQVNLVARKDNSTSRLIRRDVKISGTEYFGSTVSLADNYLVYSSIMETNPATTIAWTSTDVNDMQAGIDLIS